MPTEIRYDESMKPERQLFEDQSSERDHDGDLNEAMAAKNRGRSGVADRSRFQEKESMPKIERIRLKNFKVFKDIEMRDIPRFSVLIGKNGVGKSTLFEVFGFLRDAMDINVSYALNNLGGERGIKEVRSRGTTGPIEIELQFRSGAIDNKPLVTYSLEIDNDGEEVVVKKEVLQYRRGKSGQPWKFIDFSYGTGEMVTNEPSATRVEELNREPQTLMSKDLLAIRSLAQFERYNAAVEFGNLVNRWYISDFHFDSARHAQQNIISKHLSKSGENLSQVISYYKLRHPDVLHEIIKSIVDHIPELDSVDTELRDNRIILKFKDRPFSEPFSVEFVSDGTLRLLAYLVMLHNPDPCPLLCVEEPENQLYPFLLEELAEEFRYYAEKGSQVFVSTHSPNFLNALKIEEVFLLKKINGYTEISRPMNNEQVREYMENGYGLGKLWNDRTLDLQLS